MNTQAIPAEKRLAYWSKVIKERQESGLSVKVYCERKGYHKSIYYYWQRKLREASYGEQLRIAQAKNGESLVPNGWVVCKVITEPQNKEMTQVAMNIEIGKCKINIPREVDTELLTRVCQSLVKLC